MQRQFNRFLHTALLLGLVLLLAAACRRESDKNQGHLKQTKTFSADVAVDWFRFNIRMFRKNNINNFLLSRWWQYSSAAVYESVVPGMPAYRSLSGQLNEMPAMPQTEPGKAYHWGACANTVFAAMVRYYYNLPAADKAVTDSLEAAYNERYAATTDSNTLQRSVQFAKAVAEAVYNWSLTDGFANTYPPYVPPVGPGLWVPTPPAFLSAGIPYVGLQRPMMKGVVEATQPEPPPAYSTDPASAFYRMEKEVYDASLTLTPDQKEQAIFWRDQPGSGTFGHWFTIMTQVCTEQAPMNLEKAAAMYARMGTAQADARVSNWKAKYTYNLLRPITYIRTVMAQPTWNSYIVTPNNPDYPSAAACFAAAAAAVLSEEFGNEYAFTDRTNDFLGLPPRTYASFAAAAEECSASRLYAGIHVRPATAAGQWQGAAIVDYMKANIRFR